MLVASLAFNTVVVEARQPSPWKNLETNASWQTECGTCHMAFPASLLPAADWRRLLGSLNQHFGVDAQLDDATWNDIADYLTRNGASGPSGFDGQDVPRITTTARFVSKHQGAIRLWMRGRVDRLSNCAACHLQSDP